MSWSKVKHSVRNHIVNFIINKLVPDYSNVKADNKKLKKDIYNLVRNENKSEGIETKLRWSINFNTDDMLMFGSDTDRVKGFPIVEYNNIDSQHNMYAKGCFTNLEACNKETYGKSGIEKVSNIIDNIKQGDKLKERLNEKSSSSKKQ